MTGVKLNMEDQTFDSIYMGVKTPLYHFYREALMELMNYPVLDDLGEAH